MIYFPSKAFKDGRHCQTDKKGFDKGDIIEAIFVFAYVALDYNLIIITLHLFTLHTGVQAEAESWIAKRGKII